MERVIKDKRESSRRLAALPFAEKLRILDALRERTLTIIASRPKRPVIPPKKTGEDEISR